ncbi:MAG: hypothetical protein U0270_31745 [Labilithrix sp.]
MGKRTCLLAWVGAGLVSCGGGESSGGGGAVTGTIAGTWDVTTIGDDPAKAGSQLVIQNDTVTGTIIDKDEGDDPGDHCVHSKNRVNIEFKFQGNAMSGSLTIISEWTNGGSGGGSYCPTSDNPRPYTITGTRTNAGANADGDWEITFSDKDPFIVSIAGNSAKVWDKKDKLKGKDPHLNAVVIGNSATTSGDDDLGFAASRR